MPEINKTDPDVKTNPASTSISMPIMTYFLNKFKHRVLFSYSSPTLLAVFSLPRTQYLSPKRVISFRDNDWMTLYLRSIGLCIMLSKLSEPAVRPILGRLREAQDHEKRIISFHSVNMENRLFPGMALLARRPD